MLGKTTLMIRNIPNKYTQDLMLERIDRKFSNTYDFFYLPIDFKVFDDALITRTNATLDMRLLTSLTHAMCVHLLKN